MTEFAKVGTQQIGLLALGAILMIATPIVIAIIWTKKKKRDSLLSWSVRQHFFVCGYFGETSPSSADCTDSDRTC